MANRTPEELQRMLKRALLASYAAKAGIEPKEEPTERPYSDLSLGEKAQHRLQRTLDVGTSFGQGALLGFGDELAAAGMTAADIMRGKDIGPAWEERIEQARGVTEGAAERLGTPSHMLASGAGVTASALAGGTAAAGSKALAGSAPGRVAQALLSGTAPNAGRLGQLGAAVGSGAAWGGAYGAGEGESLGERAALGATGAAIGGGTALAMGGALGATGAVTNRFSKPMTQAKRRLVQAMRRAGIRPQAVDRAIKEGAEAGQPYTPADVMGRVGGKELSTVARKPGRGQALASDFLDERQAEQARRVATAMDEALRPDVVTTPPISDDVAAELLEEFPEEFAGEMVEHGTWHAAESPQAHELEKLVADAIEAGSRRAGRAAVPPRMARGGIMALPDDAAPVPSVADARRMVAEALDTGPRPSVPLTQRQAPTHVAAQHVEAAPGTGPASIDHAQRMVAEALEARPAPKGKSGTPAGQAPKGVEAVDDYAERLVLEAAEAGEELPFEAAEVLAMERAEAPEWAITPTRKRPAVTPDDIVESAEAERWAREVAARQTGRTPRPLPQAEVDAWIARAKQFDDAVQQAFAAPPRPRAPARATRMPGEAVPEPKPRPRPQRTAPEPEPAPATAEGYVEALKRMRGTQADEAFAMAREGAGEVDITPALRALDDALPPHPRQRARLGGEIQNALTRARGLLTTADDQPLTDFATLQQSKREIDALIESGSPSVRRVLTPVKKGLMEAMEEASPGFRAANREFTEYTRAMEAVEEGARAQRTGRPDQTVEALRGRPPAEEDAFRMGYLDRALQRIERSPEGVNVARPYTSTKAQRELETLDPTGRLAAALARENRMAQTRGLATGGSQTADNLAAMAEGATRASTLGALARGRPGQALLSALDRVNIMAPGEAARAALAEALLSTTPGTATQAAKTIAAQEARRQAIRRYLEASARAAAVSGLGNE